MSELFTFLVSWIRAHPFVAPVLAILAVCAVAMLVDLACGHQPPWYERRARRYQRQLRRWQRRLRR